MPIRFRAGRRNTGNTASGPSHFQAGSRYLFPAAVLVLSLILLNSCREEKSGPTLPSPDISGIPTLLEWHRVDQLMQTSDPESFRMEWVTLYREHPDFAVFYRDWILRIPPPQSQDPDSCAAAIYRTYVSPERMRELSDTLRTRLQNLDAPRAALDLAYRYHRHYFPGDTLPPVYTYSGVFGQPIDLTPDFAAVALTMFLGRDFSGYTSFPSDNLPRFLFHRLSPEYIPIRVMDAVARTRWSAELPDNTVLQHMVYEGKLLAYLDRVMPSVPDSLKIGFTDRQLHWVEQNQEEAWRLIVTEELLYSTRSSDIARIVGEGPHTKGMSTDSPARVGVWMGWQMVRAYLERYPDTTMDELFQLTDARLLLEASRWKPG